jgi:hypothetical protein
MLDTFDGLRGIAFVPMPIERFGRQAELDNEVAGQILRLGLATFLAPDAGQGSFVVAHDDPGVRAADETLAIETRRPRTCGLYRSSARHALAGCRNIRVSLGHSSSPWLGLGPVARWHPRHRPAKMYYTYP